MQSVLNFSWEHFMKKANSTARVEPNVAYPPRPKQMLWAGLSRTAATTAIASLVGLGACGHRQGAPDIGQIGSAITCSAADLVKPVTAACDGPWKYRLEPETVDRYSPPNLTFAQLQAQNPGRVVHRVGALDSPEAEPVCLTRDFLPVDTQPRVVIKYNKYKESWDGISGYPVDQQALRTTLGANFKLLYETKYADLPNDDARNTIRRLYSDYPIALRDCGSSFTPPLLGDCPLSVVEPINNILTMCSGLLAPHIVPPAGFAPDECINVLDPISVLPARCPVSQYVASYRDIAPRVIGRGVLGFLTTPGGDFKPEGLSDALSRINRWYTKMRQDVYTGQDPTDPAWPPDSFWQEVSQAIAGLPRAAAQPAIAAAGRFLPDGGIALANIFDAGFNTDLAILEAALPSDGGTPPLGDAPLLMVLHDGLKGMYERITDVSAMREVGCLYTQSCTDGGFPTELTELWNLLATIHDLDALNQAIGNTPHTRVAWKHVFQNIATQHAAFENAILSAQGLLSSDGGYDPRFIHDAVDGGQSMEIPLESWNAPARPLIPILREAIGRSNRAAFSSHPRNVLHFGISPRMREDLTRRIGDHTESLGGKINDFVTNQRQYVSDLLAELRGQQYHASISARYEQQVLQFNTSSDQLAALRNDAEVQQARYSDIMGVLNQAMRDAERRELVIEMRTPPNIAVYGSDSRPFGPEQRIADVAVDNSTTHDGFLPLPVLKGDVLNIDFVQAQYAPACALSKSTFRVPFRPDLPEVSAQIPDARTGPEGYLISWVGGVATARANRSVHTSGHYTQDGEEKKSCAGGQVRPPPATPEDLPRLRARSIDDYQYSDNCSIEDGYSVSVNSDYSARFTTGLRLWTPWPGPPFPYLPAGALLIVIANPVDSPTLSDIRDIHVAQAPRTSLIMPADSKVFLVVNDVHDPTCTFDDSVNLSLAVRHLHPLGAVVRTLTNAMSNVYTALKNRTDQLVQTGYVSASELASLRSEAHSELRTQCQCDIDQYPAELTSIFNTFIDKELAQLELKVKIREVERLLRLQKIELNAQTQDLGYTDHEGRLLSEMTGLNLRNVDGNVLRNESVALAKLATEEVYPVVALRYMEVFDDLRADADARGYLDALVNLDWMRPVLELANTTKLATEKISIKLSERQRIAPATTRISRVALRFPKPGRPADEQSDFHPVDDSLAQWVWSRLLDSDDARFELPVHLEDLYLRGDGPASLGCRQSVAIIRSVALVVTNRRWGTGLTSGNLNYTFNIGNWRANDMEASSSLSFATETGTQIYTLDQEADSRVRLWQHGELRILFGAVNEAVAVADAFEFPADTAPPDAPSAWTGNGLSPATTFAQSLFNLRNHSQQPLQEAAELVAVFNVETQRTANPVQLLPVCP